MTPALGTRLTETLGVEVLQLMPLSGGCIGDVYQAMLPKDNPYNVPSIVLKVSSSATAKLGIEGAMLAYLKTHSSLPVPEVLYASDTLLAMEWLPGESQFNAQSQAHAAELLAALHRVTAPSFGFETDTLIGGLPQPNPWSEKWLPFFAEHRILHMARCALEEKRLPMSLFKRLEGFCDKLEYWLLEPSCPALLHGDVWTTNVLAQGNRITGFIDPAVYYGHPEIELAFTTLFGTFDEPFFRRYEEISPIEPSFFEVRRDLYNLYPLLVHVRLFGSGYLRGIESTLKHIGH